MPEHYTSTWPTDADFYKDGDPSHRTIDNIWDDDFDEVAKTKLTVPTAEEDVASAVNEDLDTFVVLWRGTTGAAVLNMQTHGCAAGSQINAAVAKPSEAQRQQQIARGGTIPEFTTSTDLSGFSFRHWVAVVRIDTKYLAKGSGSENGWVCRPEAPVELIETVDRTLGFAEPEGFNGS